jgi:hypothetical protein
MKRLLAQHDLEAMMTSLSPLLPLVSRKSCEAGTTVLAGLLSEALEAEEASSKRTGDLKQLQPKGLMELFTPEKGNAAAAKSRDKGQKEKPQHPPPPPPCPRHEHDQQHEEGAAEVAAASPKEKKKAQAPQKRTRKATDKAANKEGLEDEGDDEEEEVKKPKKQSMNGVEKKKQSIKRAQEAWDGVEYPRIVRVTKCVEKEEGGERGEEDGGFLCVEVFSKKAGRGHWQEVGFSLDSTQLSSIDDLPQKTKAIVTASFQKALAALYGGGSQRWPKVLREALAETTWAKDMLPAVVAAAAEDGGGNEMGVFEGLGDPAAPLFDV